MTDWGAPSGERAPGEAAEPGAEVNAGPGTSTDWWASGGDRANPVKGHPAAAWPPGPDGPIGTDQTGGPRQAADPHPPEYEHGPPPSAAYSSYGAQSSPQRPFTASSLTPGILFLVLAAVLMIVGSIGDWATAHIGPLSIGASGTDSAVSQSYGVNGWVTFALAMILILLAVLMSVSEDATLRSVTVLISVVSLGFTLYFFSRVLHDVLKSQPTRFGPLGAGVDVGWGIVLLLIAALGAFAAAIAEARRR